MLKYLVILLSDRAVSYCSYDSDKYLEDSLISISDLHDAISFGMKENLMIQFVYPETPLPVSYINEINTIDHTNIMPYQYTNKEDIGVIDNLYEIPNTFGCETVIVRTTLSEIASNTDTFVKLINRHKRINIAFKNLDEENEFAVSNYRNWLTSFATNEFKDIIVQSGKIPQLNIISDRLILNAMNNCNAGFEVITVAPDGNFYVCPGFYYDKREPNGNLREGLKLVNPELFKLERAPICRICDAWHCKRCVLSNIHRTFEINIPGRIQCLISHAEREASRQLLKSLKKDGFVIPDVLIETINYNDPFEMIEK